MAVGPQAQGTEVLGGDAEHKESQKNNSNSKVILLDVGLDKPVASVPILQIRKQQPRAAPGLARKLTAHQEAAGSRSQACLEGWGAGGWLWGMGLRQGTPGLGKNNLSWRAAEAEPLEQIPGP